MLKINKTLEDNILTVALEGRLDTTTAPELEDSIAEELEAIDGIVFDFKDLDYISSAGLRILLTTHKKVKSTILKNVNPTVYEILDVTGFTDIFTIE